MKGQARQLGWSSHTRHNLMVGGCFMPLENDRGSIPLLASKSAEMRTRCHSDYLGSHVERYGITEQIFLK